MSLDQANGFRDYVAQNDDVQREIRSALMTEGFYPVFSDGSE